MKVNERTKELMERLKKSGYRLKQTNKKGDIELWQQQKRPNLRMQVKAK